MKCAFVTCESRFLRSRLIEMLVERGIEILALLPYLSTAEKITERANQALDSNLFQSEFFTEATQGMDIAFSFIAATKHAGLKLLVLTSAACIVIDKFDPLKNIDGSAQLRNLNIFSNSATKALSEATGLSQTSKEIKVIADCRVFIWRQGDSFNRDLGQRIKVRPFAYLNSPRYTYAICQIHNIFYQPLLAAKRELERQACFIADVEMSEVPLFLDSHIDASGLKPLSALTSSLLAWIVARTLEARKQIFGLKGELLVMSEVVSLIKASFTINLKKANIKLGYRWVITYQEALERIQNTLNNKNWLKNPL